MSKLKSIALWAYVVAIMFPFFFLLLLSLSSDWRYPALLPEYFGLKNWVQVVGTESGLAYSFFISLVISLSVAVTATLSGFFISRYVSYHKKKGLLTMLTYFPYILAPVVFGACLSYYFLRIGIFGTTAGVIIAQFIIAFPYALIFFSSFWNEKIKNYENLVSTLGGNRWTTFTKVLLPMAKGLMMVCFFQTFLISWFEYGLTSIIGVGKVQTLTIKVFLFIKEANFYYGAMSCCLLIIPPVVLIYINKRFVFNKLI
ncbi:ABC transporter permease [Portibacter lacus]|uniref:Sugar ABC transporter permease n=1 Tax=Portibacter lacus TaxID=1099794 RepID=A0AA37SNR6_9BACT|nr:ABC transporter permease subunit [Portibacter lacus]GLR16924.1 sugar ABC transporter permease [Portibacter lacus]